jgi:hypothetical protein
MLCLPSPLLKGLGMQIVTSSVKFDWMKSRGHYLGLSKTNGAVCIVRRTDGGWTLQRSSTITPCGTFAEARKMADMA